MQTRVENGYLVIGDVSGYTSYMADTELEHSQEIMAELLTLVLKGFTPRMSLSEVEGDAVFVYGSDRLFDRGETLLEMIEAAYVAFRDHLASMQRSTTCGCRACREIPRLDLKFIVHYGEYARQSIAGRCKAVGSNVNLVHRMLKNSVNESTGWDAYVLFSREALDTMGIHPQRMYATTESYDHLGTVATFSMNLKDRYLELADLRRIVVEENEAQAVYVYQYSVLPERMWEWLNNPERRNLWLDGTKWSIKERPDGRMGPGAVVHCAHGGGETVEKILDWRPFSYMTCEGKGGPFLYRMTTWVVPTDDGCQVRMHCKLLRPNALGLARPLGKLFFGKMANMGKALQNLQRVVAGYEEVVEEYLVEE